VNEQGLVLCGAGVGGHGGHRRVGGGQRGGAGSGGAGDGTSGGSGKSGVASSNPCRLLSVDPGTGGDLARVLGYKPGTGTVYNKVCSGPAGQISWSGFVWVPRGSSPSGGAAGAPLPTPAELARQALSSLVLPKPVPPWSPSGMRLVDGRPFTVVRVPTWFWIDPGSYKAQSTRAEVGPVWAQATATPVALTYIPGDGGRTVSCRGPGTAWTPSAGEWAHSPGGCDYSYLISSYGYSGGEMTATYGIKWQVTWSGSGGTGGALAALTTLTTARFAVAEAQAVRVR